MKTVRFFLFLLMLTCAAPTFAQVRGDVNTDQSVDISDIVAVINVIAGDGQYRTTADVNEDTKVDISDVVAIINVIAGPGYDQKQYDSLEDDVKSIIRSKAEVTNSDVSAYLTSNKYVKSCEVEDGTMYVCTTDGMELQVELNGGVEVDHTDDAELDVNSFSDQIHLALGYDLDNNTEMSAKTRYEISPFPVAEASSSFKARAVIDDGQILTSKNILVWAPWSDGFGYVKSTVEKLAGRHQLNCEVMQGSSCTLGSMLNFSKYSLVVLVCHGNKRGELCLPPTDYWKSYLGCPGFSKMVVKNEDDDVDMKEYISVNPFTAKCIPNMKFKTIIWTVMCHAGVANSAIRKACENQCVAAFVGATNIVNAYCPLNFLSKFSALFFNEGKGGVPVSYAFSGKLTQDKSLDYEFINKHQRIVEAKYDLSINKNVEFKSPNAIKAKNNSPRAYFTMLYNTIVKKKPMMLNLASSASDASSGYVEAGFCFVNTTTGERQFVPFSEENVESYQLYDYQNILSRCVITGKTDNLASGKYTYRSYLKTTEGIVYSEEGYEFEKCLTLCPDENHPHAIDLGIGVKWACCNVGASSPEQYGGYYAWGETVEKNYYSMDAYLYYSSSTGLVSLGTDISGTQYDVAHMKWGGGWHMPSYDQIGNLNNKCTSELTSINGIYGIKVTGPNGGSIFLPAAGNRWNDDTGDVGSDGYYWSSTQDPDYTYDAYYLGFNSGSMYWNYSYRNSGQSVRPVTE